MKLKYIFIGIIILFIGCNKSYDNALKLNGNVKEIKQTNLVIKYDSIGNEKLDTTLFVKTTFDKTGKIIKTLTKYYLSNKPKLTTFTNFEYNWKGQLNRENAIVLPDSNKIIVDYIYDQKLFKKGLLKKVISKDSTGFTFLETYKYNSKEQLTKKKSSEYSIDISNKDTIHSTTGIFEYNNNKNLTQFEWIDNIDDFYQKENYKYNNKGLRISMSKYDKNNNIIGFLEYKYQYDSIANWIERKTYKDDSIIEIRKRIITVHNNV